MNQSASRTADRVAQRRAAHQLLDRPLVFEDELAFSILPPEVADRIAADPQALDRNFAARSLRAFLVARSRFAEDVVASEHASGVRQYVLLGAGFDTFACRNRLSSLRVYEIDHPATQAVKRERLRNVMDAHSRAVLIPADLSTTSVRQALEGSDFDFSAPAVVAWLGVTPYLDRSAVEATLQCLGRLPVGTKLVFDYAVPRERLSFLARIVFDRMAARVAAAGEPWKTFFAESEIRDLLHASGFAQVEDLGREEINRRYFHRRADRLKVGEGGHLVLATIATGGL